MLVVFKVKAFPFKNKDKSHIFHAKSTFTLCSAAPCLFYFEAICDRYLFKLIRFKLIGWFNHHNVFSTNQISLLQIFALWYRKLHFDCKKLHCCLELIALKSTNQSRVIFLCQYIIIEERRLVSLLLLRVVMQ